MNKNKKTMQALRKQKEGVGGIERVHLPIPAPGMGEVQIRVKSAAICGTDLHIFKWNEWAANTYRIPLPLGHEFSGEVVAVGTGVQRIAPGDRVTAETHLGCGRCYQCRNGREHTCQNLKLFSQMGLGCFSEYTVLPESMLRIVPKALSNDEASILEPLGVSVRAVYEARVSGEDVWIIGCGPIGLFAIAASKAFGANRVFASDLSPYRLEVAEKVGADYTFDINSVRPSEFILNQTDGNGVGIIIETSGSIKAIQGCFTSLCAGGNLVLVGIPSAQIKLDIVKDIIHREARVWGIYGRRLYETWVQTEKLLLSGKIDINPVLTHRFSLSEHKRAFETAVSGMSGKVLFNIS